MPDSLNQFDRGYFPDISLAGEDGLLAAGGSLEPEVLLEAYSKGIFPWYSEGSPILWWSTDPRMVLFPDDFKVSKSLARTLRNAGLTVRMDTVFAEVIRKCARIPRPGQEGTWITGGMIDAYISLHNEGYAHSVEVFRDGDLVGGVYGISLGKAFFGESMFHIESDASKIALYHLVEFSRSHEFHFIDTQQSTSHLQSLGAREIPRKMFIEHVDTTLRFESLTGSWENLYRV